MTQATPVIGRTVKMYLVDGTVDGLVTAEVMNWTGHVISIPRPLLPRLKNRPEADRTGLYLLLGEDEGRRTAYIGETDEMYTRLAQHAKDPKQDFFSRAIVITSTSDTMTKAHVRRLEHLAYERDSRSGNYALRGNKPYDAKLPESDATDMLAFFEQIELVLPTMGIDLLQAPRPREEAVTTEQGNIEFEIISPKNALHATAREDGGQFIVLAGSLANVKPGAKHSQAMRKTLQEGGKLVVIPGDEEHLVFAQDVSFSSPSAAASAVYNRSTNGRDAWRVKGAKVTYAQHEQNKLAE